MKNWKQKISIKNILDDAADKVITLDVAALRIAEKLETIKHEDCQSIIDDFRFLSEDNEATVEEFDELLYDMWNFADANNIWIGAI